MWAFYLFAFGAATDAIDGIVARLRKESTQLGQFLDPLADKLLLISGYVGVSLAKDFALVPPVWVVVTIVFRDIVIIGGLIVLYFSNAHPEVSPNPLGKFTTAFQMITMMSILLLLPISRMLWNVTAGLTVLSGISYIARGLRRNTNFKRHHR